MIEVSEEKARRIEENDDWERWLAHHARFVAEGRDQKEFETNVYLFRRDCGLAAAATVEDGILAVKEIERGLIWRAAGWAKQNGWLNTAVAAGSALGVVVFLLVMLLKNWEAIPTIGSG